MSKSIGKFLGAGSASTSPYGSEKSILRYLNNYDTSQTDAANANMAAQANILSSNLSNRPDYIYSVSGSDEAAKRVENATYQNAINKITPQFEAQRQALESRLQNQGLSVGSAAYQNAMSNLYTQQNNAYQQAAFDSISAGQNAYANSLNNQISAANFQNNARNLPITEIMNLLQNSKSGYDVNMDKYAVRNKMDARISKNTTDNTNAQQDLGWNVINYGMRTLFSDAELKENIIEVGRLYNGLKVYLYTYKGETTPQIGLLAQDVATQNPQAVYIDDSGFFKVNYALACQ